MEEPYIHKIFVDRKEQKEPIALKKYGFVDVAKLTSAKSDMMEEAVFAYPIKHYTNLQVGETFNEKIGSKNENFAVLEMDEYSVFIGDTFRIGEAIIQVSQPGPVSVNWLESGLQTGWYFRVLEEGNIKGGVDLELIDRPYPDWSIAACIEVVFLNKDDLRTADNLYSCELLAAVWRRTLRKRLLGF
ncbi:MOSC domain-containing protein [Oceanobacillus longus]|uniref:MOSC domain-containing protein n=1 Tax=Oceanobacillus longus TaxID=930120 RepID=A0ABV8GUB9_9BACI